MNQKNQLSNFLFLSVSWMPISCFFQFLRCQTHLKSPWMCLLRSNFSQQVPQPPLSNQTFFFAEICKIFKSAIFSNVPNSKHKSNEQPLNSLICNGLDSPLSKLGPNPEPQPLKSTLNNQPQCRQNH